MSAVTESSPRSPQIGAVFEDTWSLYRSLFRQTLVIGGLVFAVLGLLFLDTALSLSSSRAASLAVGLVALALPIAGTALVQGALIEVVDDEHEGRMRLGLNALYRRTLPSLGRLLAVTLATFVCILVALLLLIVPGLFLMVRWSLVVPVVLLERRRPLAAMRRSWRLVRGHGWPVFGALLVASVITGVASFAFELVAGLALGSAHRLLTTWVAFTLGGAIATPYFSHVLSVLYYRLADPGRPVLPGPQPPGPATP